MSELKYIVLDDVFPVVFGSYFSHKDVAAGLSGQVTSAGFVSKGADGTYSVYGKSISLGLVSNPEDAELINNLLGTDT